MMDGLAGIVDGVTNKANKGWVRGFTIGVGVLAVIISIMILAAPVFGAVFCWPHYSNGSTNNRRRESLVPSSTSSLENKRKPLPHSQIREA
jgi:hypothetical protein